MTRPFWRTPVRKGWRARELGEPGRDPLGVRLAPASTSGREQISSTRIATRQPELGAAEGRDVAPALLAQANPPTSSSSPPPRSDRGRPRDPSRDEDIGLDAPGLDRPRDAPYVRAPSAPRRRRRAPRSARTAPSRRAGSRRSAPGTHRSQGSSPSARPRRRRAASARSIASRSSNGTVTNSAG